jgi:hypothetical protein
MESVKHGKVHVPYTYKGLPSSAPFLQEWQHLTRVYMMATKVKKEKKKHKLKTSRFMTSNPWSLPKLLVIIEKLFKT